MAGQDPAFRRDLLRSQASKEDNYHSVRTLPRIPSSPGPAPVWPDAISALRLAIQQTNTQENSA